MNDPRLPEAARPTLYVLPASYPCAAVEYALRMKNIEYDCVGLPFGASMIAQQRRFGRRTVPGLAIGKERVVGSRLIMRALEGIEPEPSLYPTDREVRRAHDEAERWGEQVFQEVARWVPAYVLVRSHPELLRGYMANDAAVDLPPQLMATLVRAEMRVLRRTPKRVEADIAALPNDIEMIGQWHRDGLLGNVEHPAAAGLQILSCVRMLLTLDDLIPLFAAAGLEEPARILFPDFPGHLPQGSIDVSSGIDAAIA